MGVMWIQMIVSFNTQVDGEQPKNDKPIDTEYIRNLKICRNRLMFIYV